MLNELTQLAQEVGTEYMLSDNGLDNEHADKALGLASSTITESLQEQIASGNGQEVMNLLSGQQQVTSGNPIVNSIIGTFAGNIMQKFGIKNQVAQTIAAVVIPMVLQQLISKTNNPNDNSFNLQGILGGLFGNNSQMGGFDIGSLLNMVGGQTNQNQQGGNDMIGGLINTFLGGK
jgi:hypothetical protein